MRSTGSPYEVRCPRCDVSFPIETRRCIHCGGPTAAADSPPPIAVDTGRSFPWSRPQEASAGAPREPASPGSAGSEVPEEAPGSIGSSLLRTFGSLFWVIALIGYSLMRSCSEG